MIDAICQAWEQAGNVEHIDDLVPCRTGIEIGSPGDTPRFAYVSVGSPIEQVLGTSSRILDRAGGPIETAELATRLLDDEVAAVVASPGPAAVATATDLGLPQELIDRRNTIRQQHVLARFLIRQIGLEEVSSHRGAPAQLYTQLASLWSRDLSMCVDPAMLLGLGADRQRFVDENYNARATDRLPRALGRLHNLGVRSYPRLVIV